MAKNKKKKNTENIQVYTRDDAYKSLEMVNTWISNMDTKVSFALGLTGVMIGFIFGAGFPSSLQKVLEASQITELNGGELIGVILVCMLYVVSFLSVISFVLTIVANVKNTNDSASIFFFGSIGKMELENYKTKLSQLTEQQIVEDLEEQIHTNSKICSQKAKWYNIGMRFLMATIILWFVCVVFRLI